MESSSNMVISCRITRTLLLYVRQVNNGSLDDLLEGLDLDEPYLLDPDNWISHAALQILYQRMIRITGDPDAVYNMTVSTGRLQSLGILDRIARLVGTPKLLYSHAPRYNKMLKLNGDILLREVGDSWVILEDRYHDSAQKTRYDCDYTRGMLAMIPTMFGLPPAEVEELECQVAPGVYGTRIWPDHPDQGRPGCLYRVQWNTRSMPGLFQRLFGRRKIYQDAIQDLLDANRRIQEKYRRERTLALELEEANQELSRQKQQLEAYAAKIEGSERKYRLLTETLPDVIWTMDLATLRFRYISPQVKKVRGFSPAEARALSLEQSLSPESGKLALEALAREMEMEKTPGADPDRPTTLELQQTRKDGAYQWGETIMRFLRDEQGAPVGILGITRDISARKRAEEENRALQAQLNQAQKLEAIGRLASGVAHDLNNILSGVVSYPELLLLELPEDSPHRELVATIKNSGLRAAAIVQDLVSLARRGISDSEIVVLNPTILQYLSSPEHTTLIQGHPQVRMEVDLADDLLNIKGSPHHLSKIIMNLVNNAAEAMPAGGRVLLSTANCYMDVRSTLYEPVPEGEYVCLTVRDEGVGISQQDLKNIFEPFYTKKSMGRSGSGLGMTVVWASVKDLNGYIDVQSREGEGSSFTIYLPATREEHLDEPRRVTLNDYLGSETILVVDDMAEQRRLAASMLGKLGYTVTVVASGEEAVEHLREHEADLMVLDMIMPGMDGLETYRRALEIRPGQKVIIASGYSESRRVRELQRLGAGGYVQKPYTLEKIGMAVRAELDRA
jgi:PAS domain S-box-containing protein